MKEIAGEFNNLAEKTFTYRHIRPGDSAALQRFHGRLSGRSIYQRFFGSMPVLSDQQAAYFTAADGVDRVAFIAIDPADPVEIIGVVRFDRESGTNSAEYAAIVEDRWQGHGVGYGLTQVVVQAARERGIEMLYAFVLPGNSSMLALLHDLGYPETVRYADGAERVELTLPPLR